MMMDKATGPGCQIVKYTSCMHDSTGDMLLLKAAKMLKYENITFTCKSCDQP